MWTGRASKVVAASIDVACVAGALVCALGGPRPSSGDGVPPAPTERPAAKAAPPRPRGAASTPAAGSVVSVVEDSVAGRRPIADARVELHRRGVRETMRSTTDSDGVARFGPLSDGDWLAAASASGHLDGHVAFRVEDGAATAAVEVDLKKKGVVRGTVFDASGTPAARAEVLVRAVFSPDSQRALDRGARPAGPSVGNAASDDFGRFVVGDVVVGEKLVIWARHPTGGVRTFEIAPLRSGEERVVDVALERVSGIHGEVPADLLGDGAGAVDLFRRDGRATIQEGRAAVNASACEYRFLPTLSGAKALSFTVRQANRFFIGFQEAQVSEGEILELGAWRPSDSLLRLRLRPFDEKLVGRDADLEIEEPETSPPWHDRVMHVRVPIGPELTFQGLPAGRISLSTAPIEEHGMGLDPRRGVARDGFEFDGKLAERELVLVPEGGVGPKGVTRFVAVLPEGIKTADSKVRWILWSGGAALNRSPRAPRGVGAYNTGLIAAGRYRVEAFGEGFVATKEFEQPDGDQELKIEAGLWTAAPSVSGRVLDGGAAAGDALVMLCLKDDTGAEFSVDEVRSAADGSFEFPAMPRSNALSVYATSETRSSPRVALDGFHAAKDVVLEMKP